MEKLIQYKKTKIEEETKEEFYLNPKDMVNNDKVYESSNTLDVMYYLPLNELLVVIFEENFVVIDIKKTLSRNFTIIKMFSISDIFKKAFNENDEKKSVPSSSDSFGGFCFKIRESDLKKIKNFSCIEIKNKLNQLFFLIEFVNLDFVIIKYDNINTQTDFNVLFTQTKSFFAKNSKNLKLNYETCLIMNYATRIACLEEKNNSKTFNLFYQVESLIFVYKLSEDSCKFFQKLSWNSDIKTLIADYSHLDDTNEIIFYIVNVTNSIQKATLNTDSKTFSEGLSLNKPNEGNITLIKADSFKAQKILLYAQLNAVYIYDFLNSSLLFKITFALFEDWIISYCFITLNEAIYIFNSNGDYSYSSLNLSQPTIGSGENPFEITNSSMDSLKISKQIYSVKEFNSRIGFFILSTQNPIKIQNVNITYFLPEQISDHMSLEKMIERSPEVKSEFYSFSLCEFLIIKLRFHSLKDFEENKFDENNIIKGRLQYYLSKIFQEEEGRASCEGFLHDILQYYKKINDISSELYKNYLSNEKYLCDFCSEKFLTFNTKTMIFSCKNNHSTFSCCVTQVPFDEKFLTCPNCGLLYSEEFKVCLGCQQMLQLAIM